MDNLPIRLLRNTRIIKFISHDRKIRQFGRFNRLLTFMAKFFNEKACQSGDWKVYFFALKQIYSFSICVLKFQNELSNSIRMERGVRQGDASTVLLSLLSTAFCNT